MTQGVSIRPSQMVEGGAVPVDRNLLWEECRFATFDYTKKDGTVVATTTAARIKYKDDDGTEYVQHYSAADPERFVPSADGKTLVAAGSATALSKSSNFYLLMNALISAGFPENKLDADISTLDGLYTHNIGMPEPKRSGLARPVAEGEAREKIISVPSQILKLPWENKGAVKGKAAPAKGKAAPATTEADGDVAADALALVAELVANAPEGKPVTRQQVATKAIREKKNAVGKFVFGADFARTLTEAGYSVEGENITAG
jgi:hypothetical protein